jgi:cytochrome bd-type quinol oxidase subunit 1
MKQTIKIQLDYLQGQIWISDVETGQPLTGISIIDNDKNFKKLILKFQIYIVVIMNLILMINHAGLIKIKKKKINLKCYLY